DAPDEAPKARTPAATQVSAATVSAAAISAAVGAGRARRDDDFMTGPPSPPGGSMSRLTDMTDAGPRWLRPRNAGHLPPAGIAGQIAGYCASSKRRGSSQERGPASAFVATRRGGRGVRIVELSNHPGVRLKEIRQRRAHAEKHVRSQSEEARDQHLERVKAARDSRDQARAQHRWWAWLRSAVALRREQRQAPAPPARATGTSDQEEILRAGIAREQLVAAGLGQVLGDDWTLLRGYRNKRGEIDHLLLGPQGLVAIEGKHLNATVHCVGDTWRYCKFDRY